MILPQKRLYQDKYAEYRDYQLKDAISKKEKMVFIYKGKRMTRTTDEVKEQSILFNKTPQKSKINLGQTYLIYSLLFEPNKEMSEDEQLKQFSEQVL